MTELALTRPAHLSRTPDAAADVYRTDPPKDDPARTRPAAATVCRLEASRTVTMGSSFAVDIDEITLARAKKGELAALEALFRAFETPVFNLGRRLLGNAHDAEDVVQDTFLEVVRSVRAYRGDGPFWGWVRKVAASKALMRLRRDRSRPEETPLDEALPPADDDGHPASHPPRHGDRLDLEAALAAVSEAGRAVVWLHDVEGYTHEEIAAMMGKTASFSKSQLARAHVRLRALLGDSSPCTQPLPNCSN